MAKYKEKALPKNKKAAQFCRAAFVLCIKKC